MMRTLLILIFIIFPIQLFSQNLSFDTSILNKYIWRGIVISKEPVIQPSLSIELKEFNLNVFGNIDIFNDENYDINLNEIDYTFNYSHNFDYSEISFGLIYYTFPNMNLSSTTELYMSVKISSIFNPSVAIYKDIQYVNGTYLLFGISPNICLNSRNFDFSMSVGLGSKNHNLFYYGSNKETISDVILNISTLFNLSENIYLTPTISFVDLIDNNIRKSQLRKDNILLGLIVSTSF